jgi:hypothetical protein
MFLLVFWWLCLVLLAAGGCYLSILIGGED